MPRRIYPPDVEPQDFIKEWRDKSNVFIQPLKAKEVGYFFLMGFIYLMCFCFMMWTIWELVQYLVSVFIK